MNIVRSSDPKEDDQFLESGDHQLKQHDDTTNNHQHDQHYNISKRAAKTSLLFAVLVITCIVVLNQSSNPSDLFRGSYYKQVSDLLSSSSSSSCDANSKQGINNVSSSHSSLAHDDNEVHVLKDVLKRAAMEDNKTVIITTLNSAWTEPNSIFDLFLESFRIGDQTEKLLKHVVVVSLDQIAYNRCVEVGLHCYVLITDGVDFSGEKAFMSEDYLKMMWRRIDFLRLVLEMGYDFVFTDADVMWLRDPFQRFFPDGDFQIACDHYWFNYTDRNNSPNGGFNYVRSNNKTVQLYKFWYEGRRYYPGKHDQDVLNYIKFNPFLEEIGLEMRFLDTAYFGGFCEPSKDIDLVITMHANCCIGLGNKIHDIKMAIDDWKRYKMVVDSGGERNLTVRSWTVPRICG